MGGGSTEECGMRNVECGIVWTGVEVLSWTSGIECGMRNVEFGM